MRAEPLVPPGLARGSTYPTMKAARKRPSIHRILELLSILEARTRLTFGGSGSPSDELASTMHPAAGAWGRREGPRHTESANCIARATGVESTFENPSRWSLRFR
jgi:hypothetical protein